MDDSTRVAKRDHNPKHGSDRRVGLRTKARQRYRAGIRTVGQELLEESRQDSRCEERRGIRDYIICRVCGAKLARITIHLPRLHDLDAERYWKQFPGAPLVSSRLRTQLSAGGKRAKREFRGIARLDMSSVRSHPGQKPARDWSIVRNRVEGKTTIQIGRTVERRPGWVKVMCRRLGLTASPCGYDLGSPMTWERLARLYEASGLQRGQFARFFGVPSGLIDGMSRATLRLRIGAAHSASIVKARDAMISEVYRLNRDRGGSRRWTPSAARILRSLIPDFRGVSATLRNLLAQTRRFLKQAPEAGAEQWQDWLCEQARREIAGLISGKRFKNFLPLAAELSDFIDLSALRTRGDLWLLSMEILAARFNVSSRVTSHCEGERPLPPRDVKSWILEAWHSRAGAPPITVPQGRHPKKPHRRGPDKTPFPLTKKFEIGKEVEQLAARGKSPTDARKEIARKYGHAFDTVRRYHQLTLRHLASGARELPR